MPLILDHISQIYNADTEHPGKALEEALTFGQLLTVKIENMKEQHRKAAEKYEREKAKNILPNIA